MIHATSPGLRTVLAGPRLERLAWLFLAAAALGLFCDHAAHASCAPPAGLSYEVSRVRREMMRELVALPGYRMDNRGSALV
jgi:hypothetical protein